MKKGGGGGNHPTIIGFRDTCDVAAKHNPQKMVAQL